MTAREFLTKTFQLAGIIAGNETLSASESNDAFDSFNELLESWSVEGLMVPTVAQESFSTVAAQQAYTIGSGGNFNTTRPIEIQHASIVISGVVYPLRILNTAQRAEIDQSLSGMPTALYYDKAATTGNIYLYPNPDAVYTLRLHSLKQLTAIASLDTSIAFQPGYQRALRYNMAVDLAPEYGRELSQVIISTAFNLKADLKRQNIEPVYLKSDYTTGKTYNINTGE